MTRLMAAVVTVWSSWDLACAARRSGDLDLDINQKINDDGRGTGGRGNHVKYLGEASDEPVERKWVPEPPPAELFQMWDSVDFASQPWAEQFLTEGQSPMTDDQRVWMSHYTEGLLRDAIAGVEESRKTPIRMPAGLSTEQATLYIEERLKKDMALAKALSILHHAAPLSEAVLWTPQAWEENMATKIDAVMEALKHKKKKVFKQLLMVLEKINTGFYKEMHFARSHFYLGVVDQIAFKHGEHDAQSTLVPLEQLRHMHTLDTQPSRDKSDLRKASAFSYFRERWRAGDITTAKWSLNQMLEDYPKAAAVDALASQTDLLAFPVLDGEIPNVPGPFYVLAEGNGRLAALNAAVDEMRGESPEFPAPHLNIKVIQWTGSEQARANWLFFLRNNWRNQFPAIEIPGWKPFIPDSVRKVSEEYANVIKARPRYFGYRPEKGQVGKH